MLYAWVWCVQVKKIKSPAPLLEDPRTPKLEKLLTEDPHKVMVKTNTEETKNRTKNMSIREGVSDPPTRSEQNSSSGSNANEEAEKEENKAHSSRGCRGDRLPSSV